MDIVLRFFLRLVTLPGKIGWSPFFRVLSLLAGIGFLYLLTLREDEEGRAGDYIQRLRNRIHKLRLRALSSHLSILKSIASGITRFADRLFGSKLFSIQAIGVSIALALFAFNLYYFFDTLTTGKSDWGSQLFAATVFLSFALFPAVRNLITDNKQKLKKRKPSKSLWLHVWAIALLAFTANEHVAPMWCTDCLPPQYRRFFFFMMLMVTAVAIVSALLFTSFIFITRLSLKKLSTASSAWKGILFLLIGCTPTAVFWVIVKLVAFIIINTSFTSASSTDPHRAFHFTAQELFAMSSIIVFGSSFYTNVAFVITPVIFFCMAILLLLNRLLWPVLERPLETLHRLGIAKHRKLIAIVGVILILFGVGKTDWLEKLWKLIA